VRWLGDVSVDAADEGVYVFTVEADDKVQLWIDNTWLLDAWDDTAREVTTYQEAVQVFEGSHSIRLEYVETSEGDADGGDAALTWSKIDQEVFNLQYFSSSDLSGTPTDGGTVPSISSYTGSGSARWVGVFEFEESDYDFTITTDGSALLYVDGQQVIGLSETSAKLPLEEGLHSIKVEYFAGTSITVDWAQTSEIAGHALEFEGLDDYVSNATPAMIPIDNETYTIEAWVYPDTMDDLGIVGWGNYGTTNQVNALRLNAGGIRNYWWGNDLQANTVDISGAWHHIAATFDGTTRRIYLDGTLVSFDTPTGHTVPSATNFTIGTTNTDEYWNGKIDEVRIWNVGRSQAEIQAYMKSTLNGDESNLVQCH
jgi:hypothetical protein